MNKFPKFNSVSPKKILGGIFITGIVVCVIKIVLADTPNPGHLYTKVAGGVVQGDILYGSGTDTLAALTKNASTTRYLSNTGGSNNPAWAQVDLSNGVTGVLTATNGGTGNAYFTVSGPAATRTFTFPNADAIVLTSNDLVTVAQGGTGLNTLTANNVILGNNGSTPQFVAPGTSGNVLTSNGTTWISSAPTVGTATISTYTGTGANAWSKPNVGNVVLVQMWAGGGSGGAGGSGDAGGGGGGGGYMEFIKPLSSFAASETCTVGAGGAAASGASADTAGNVGNNTTMTVNGTTYTVYGGGPGCGVTSADCGGGGGGGIVGVGQIGTSAPAGGLGGLGGGAAGAGTAVGVFGGPFGGGGGTTVGGSGDWGGAGGGLGNDTAAASAGGYSLFGGGGGGGGNVSGGARSGGTSVLGGSGGAGSTGAGNNGTAGTQPAGGGGGTANGTSGKGGDGECIITVW